MSRCSHCKIEIIDDTEYCPLCHHALSKHKEEQTSELLQIDTYPDISTHMRKRDFLIRLVVFLAVISGLICGYVNFYIQKDAKPWSLVVMAGLVYGLWMLRMFIRDTGYLRRMFDGVFGAALMVIIIDYATGFRGWSVDYVLPGGMILLDLGLLILMIINHRNWQSYMVTQIIMILFAFIPQILVRHDIVVHPLLSHVAFLTAVIVFLGTVILGGSTAKAELERRFHI